MPWFDFVWNDEPGGNVDKVVAHGLTTDDVEAVLTDPAGEAKSRSSGRDMAFGYTADGRYICVVYERLDKVTLLPVTAYEVEE